MSRPPFIRHWRELESAEQVRPPVMDEPFGYVAEFAPAANISHLRVGHIRLPPGVRSHPPIASRDEDAFFFVLKGAPNLWFDGYLHRLKEGDGVCLPARTGIAHAMLNNTNEEVHLFFFGEGMHVASRFGHPVDPAAAGNLEKMGKLWADAPRRKLGPHDGLTDARRGAASPKGSVKRKRPDFVAHWREILSAKANRYPNDSEPQGINAPFGRLARFSRIGVHVEVLKPGRRTSRPHAERDEDEFVYVVSGRIEAWNDGYTTPMGPGDFIGWQAGTGITHVILNNSDEDTLLIVGGEAGRRRNQFWYPFHTAYNKTIGELYWADHPVPRLGPHDGLPDALRAKAKPARKAKAKKAKKKSRR